MSDSPQGQTSSRLLVAGGLAGAVLASSCCVLPLALVMLGIGGAWVASLTALAVYKPYFLVGATILVGLGFRQACRQPAGACEPGTLCAVPASRRITKTVLWAAAALVVLSASVDLWAPLFW